MTASANAGVYLSLVILNGPRQRAPRQVLKISLTAIASVHLSAMSGVHGFHARKLMLGPHCQRPAVREKECARTLARQTRKCQTGVPEIGKQVRVLTLETIVRIGFRGANAYPTKTAQNV